MKRAFTLVEMLFVVALIATLMTIVFRISSVGSEEKRRNNTIVRLSKLENCLSGYYAAYGSYPPVRLHNSRSIYEGVNKYGVQNMQGSTGQTLSKSELWSWNVETFQKDAKAASDLREEYSKQEKEVNAWKQVKAACESQPVALGAPDPDIEGLDEMFKTLQHALIYETSMSESYADYAKWKAGFKSIYNNIGRVDDSIPWRQTQIFKFGLMSYLLPRFQAMMGWKESDMFANGSCVFQQWNANNGLCPHDPLDGGKTTWKDINEDVSTAMGYGKNSSANVNAIRSSSAYLEALPSEAVTARWMPNLGGICTCDYPKRTFFGVLINDQENCPNGLFTVDQQKVPPLNVYSPSGRDGDCYHLNTITVQDGWLTEFFYYSPTPHQSYQLWSAGKNKRTFPPWISRQNLEENARKCVAAWTEDDIRGMSN